jgi:hypothetical protein
MNKRKKSNVAKATDTAELKRIREGLQREAQALRARAGSLAVARDELTATGLNDFSEAVAFLNGQIRAYYGTAATLDDLRNGDDLPF